MAVNSTNPAYAYFLEDWKLLRTAYKGERAIKEQGTKYLPATRGMILDGQGMGKPQSIGELDYQAYKARALWPDHISMAVEFYIGLLHKRKAQFKLPKQMEYLLEKASEKGDTLEQMLRKINEQQLVCGRLGLLADFPMKPTLEDVQLYLCMYLAEAVINWDEGPVEQEEENQLKLVVLNESENVRTKSSFEWTTVEKWRVLSLGEIVGDTQTKNYRTGLFVQTDGNVATFNEEAMSEPSIRGRTLEKIPFSFINSKDTQASPDDPPLLGLARLALAMYRNSADYEQTLFMQGQETLVIINGKQALESEGAVRTGAGQVINVKAQGDAKYIGVNSQGLPEQREALEAKYKRADDMAGRVIDTTSKAKESGEALNTRLSAQTATLNQIARTGAAGLQYVLRAMAEWLGLDPLEVEVTPNLEFADSTLSAEDFTKFMGAKAQGLPLSEESLHALLVDGGFTVMSYEDEMDKVEAEPPRGSLATMINEGLAVPGDPNSATPPTKPKKAGGPRGPARSTRKPAAGGKA